LSGETPEASASGVDYEDDGHPEILRANKQAVSRQAIYLVVPKLGFKVFIGPLLQRDALV
jgi:hypothetical protein